MSATYDLVCKDCEKGLWIGQQHYGKPGYIYTSMPDKMELLSTFLYDHAGHHLIFQEGQRIQFDYEDIEEAQDN